MCYCKYIKNKVLVQLSNNKIFVFKLHTFLAIKSASKNLK